MEEKKEEPEEGKEIKNSKKTEEKEQEEKEIEEKLENLTKLKLVVRFKNWLKDPYNKIFLAILIFLIIFRFYWFFKTIGQPFWWDEADYMNMARTFIGAEYWKSTFSESSLIRPILFPLIIAGFLFIGLGETSVRLLVLLCSIVSVPLIYAIGKQFFNKKTALFSAFILAVFWSFSFYSHRLLVDVPIAMLWLATIYLFFNAYFKNKNYKHFVVAGVFLGLSFLMKFSSVILVAIFTIYLLTTEKLKVFNKKIILFYLTSFLTVLPYFIWQYVAFGHPFAFYIKARATGPGESFRTFTQSLIDQTLFSFKLIHWVFLMLFLIGLFVILSYLFLLYNKIIIKKSNSNKYYFILLWLILSLLFFGWLNYGTYMEERYYFIFYSAIFLIAGKGLFFVYDTIKKYHKGFAIVIILILLGFGAYQNISHANQIIEIKKDSYIQLKQAGLWIGKNTNPDDVILILEEPAEISYYSERNYVHIGHSNASTILEEIRKHKPKYAVLSFLFSLGGGYEEAINFVFSNPQIFKPVKSYPPYIDKEQRIPLAIIFEIQNAQSP